MTGATHDLRRPALRALAAGGGGPEAIRRLRDAELSRTRLLVHHIVERSAAVGHPHAALVRRAFAVLLDVERAAAATVAALLANPAVGAWAVRTAQALHGARPALANPGFLAAVTAAAAALAGLPAVLDVPANPDGNRCIALPGVGWFDSGGVALLRLRTGHGGAPEPMPTSGAPRWHAIVRISAVHDGLRLAVDLDPAAWHHALGTAYCGERGVDGGEPDLGRWRDGVATAWALLGTHHRGTAYEVAAALRVLVPLAAPARGTTSSTFAEAFGAVAMSAPAGPRSTALALAHELQHSKFTVLARLHPLLDEEVPALHYYAPWRRDPRPLGALLDGAYAFLAVARFWRTQRRIDIDERSRQEADVHFQRWAGATHDVTRMLLHHPALTDMGRFVTARMLARVHRWLQEPASERAAAAARDAAAAHLAQCRRAYPHGVDAWYVSSTLVACRTP
jgi:HEXXH motif-containing protein